MRAIGNFFWFILGGAVMGLAWWIAGLAAFITIVGIPWGKACFVIGQFSFFPFGREAISRKELKQKDDIGTDVLGLLGNIIWFFFAGVWSVITQFHIHGGLFLLTFWLAFNKRPSMVFCVSTLAINRSMSDHDRMLNLCCRFFNNRNRQMLLNNLHFSYSVF